MRTLVKVKAAFSTAEVEARIDALAARLGKTRAQMLEQILRTGLDAEERRLAETVERRP